MSGSAYFLDPATYDRIYAGFTADLPHYLELMKHAGGPALEVACGNDRLEFRLRYVFKPEMELLLRAAGFTRWEMRPLFSNYQDDASTAGDRPAREGDSLLWTAWRS